MPVVCRYWAYAAALSAGKAPCHIRAIMILLSFQFISPKQNTLPNVKAQRRGDYAQNDSITITIDAFAAPLGASAAEIVGQPKISWGFLVHKSVAHH